MSALGGVGSAAAVSSSQRDAESDNGFGALDNDEFFQIIMAELGAQDPLEPNDTKALIEQISLIRGIESDEQISSSLESLTGQNEFAAATGMIGTLVSGITQDGVRVSDLVASVSRTLDGPVLNLLDGSRMSIDQVDEALGSPLLDFGGGDDEDETSDDEPVEEDSP